MGNVSASNFTIPPIDVQVTSHGQLEVNAHGQKFRIKNCNPTSGLERYIDEIRHFFRGLLQSGVDLTKGKISKFHLTKETADQISVSFLQETKSSEHPHRTMKVRSHGIDRLFGNAKNKAWESKLEIRNVTPLSFIQKIVLLFRDMIHSIFGKDEFSEEVIAEFKELVEQLPIATQKKIYKSLSRVTDDERYLLHYLANNLQFENMDRAEALKEIFNGGYVLIHDEGKTYDLWKRELDNKATRRSTHESSDEQFATRGPLVKEFLFSKKQITQPDGTQQTATWFQLERYPVHHLGHLLSLAIYMRSGKQQGPCGESHYQEKGTPILATLQ